MTKLKNYNQVIKYIAKKYNKDYTTTFKRYASNIRNLKKNGKAYHSLSYYLNKKAQKLLQTSKATYTRQQLRAMSDKQLKRRWIGATQRFLKNRNNKDTIRELQRYKGETLRRRIKNSSTNQQRNIQREIYSSFKKTKKIGKLQYTPISSYAISSAKTMSIQEYAEYLGVSVEEALNQINNSPLKQVEMGWMTDGYIDEQEKIIVYTK